MSETPEREPMSIPFAVFNGHINDADKRAREVMRAECPQWLDEVEAIEREGNGIMAIFDAYDPSPAVNRYACLVQDFVNGDDAR